MQGRYTVTTPNYTIGAEAYEKIREVCPRYGKTIVVIGGRRGIEAAQEKMIKAVEGVGMEFTGFINGGGLTTYETIDVISRDPAVEEADIVFAVGGGRAMDTAKIVADRLHKPYFTLPTVAGSCSACSRIATIYTPDGKFLEYASAEMPPVHVFLCSRILSSAPSEFLLRGIGDTMAKCYEAQIAARGQKLTHRDGIGVALAGRCAGPIYEFGAQAIEDNKNHRVTDAFEEVALAVIMTSGLVSNFAAPEYHGQIAHAVFAELATLPENERCSHHGGLAAYGILLLLLCDKQQEEFERFYAFCETIGLPTCRQDIGASEEEIRRVFRLAVQKQNSQPLPYKVTQKMLNGAAEELEAYHQKKHQA